jgi:ubiquinone/menaquinone biosynthesis C-methylase UbiE
VTNFALIIESLRTDFLKDSVASARLGGMDMLQQEGGISSQYLQLTATLLAEIKRHSYELMCTRPGHKVLDVACGIGTDTARLAGVVGPGGRVVGIDSDATMIAEASRFAAKQGVSGWTSHELGDAASLRFETGSFDACRSERLFQHLRQPAEVLTEMVRVTKRGGWIVVLDTDWGTLSIDTPERETERNLARFLAEHALRNGYAGRQLYRLFRVQKLAEISVEMIPHYVTKYAMARALGHLDRVEDEAIAAGVITKNQLKHWHQSLERADHDNAFFASISMFVVAGRKS